MLTKSSMNYAQNGVLVYSGSDRVRVVYHGLLAESGATHLYAHVGYGSYWDKTQDLEMLRTTEGFEVTIPLQHKDKINMAFKDCANNWDNNSGHNYTFDLVQ
jgi:hypothetical protein